MEWTALKRREPWQDVPAAQYEKTKNRPLGPPNYSHLPPKAFEAAQGEYYVRYRPDIRFIHSKRIQFYWMMQDERQSD